MKIAFGHVAQLVEQWTETSCVASSILAVSTKNISRGISEADNLPHKQKDVGAIPTPATIITRSRDIS